MIYGPSAACSSRRDKESNITRSDLNQSKSILLYDRRSFISLLSSFSSHLARPHGFFWPCLRHHLPSYGHSCLIITDKNVHEAAQVIEKLLKMP